MRRTRAPMTRSIYSMALFETHQEHVRAAIFDLESCDYCRMEYYRDVRPLGLPEALDSHGGMDPG